MGCLEPKKLAPLRILQILQEHSDRTHPLTQEDIADRLDRDYGIVLERKAVGRNLRLLKDAGYTIESVRDGSYLDERQFEDAELRMLIDGVLSSKYITANHSKGLIRKLCGLSNRYFRSHVKNVYSVHDWSKTDNQALFFNIELIDEAIERGVQLKFDFNKYGVDKKLHRSSTPRVTPYQLILHNQRYYLMACHAHWKTLFFYRVDHITNMQVVDKPAIPITDLAGYEGGIMILLVGLGIHEVVSTALFLLILTVSVVVLVASSIEEEHFRKRYPVISDFYTDQEKEDFHRRLIWHIAGGVGAILFGVILLMLFFTVFPEQEPYESLAASAFLLIIAGAVMSFIYAGMQDEKYKIWKYNRDNNPTPEAKQKLNIIGAACGVIMLLSTAVYVALGFTRDAWGTAWWVFPVGGILCGAVSIALNPYKGED